MTENLGPTRNTPTSSCNNSHFEYLSESESTDNDSSYSRGEILETQTGRFLPIRDIFGVKIQEPTALRDLPKHFIAPALATLAVSCRFFSKLNPIHATVMTASTVLADKLSEIISETVSLRDLGTHQYINAIFHVAATALQAYVMTQLLSINLTTFTTYYVITNLTKTTVNATLYCLRKMEMALIADEDGNDYDDSNSSFYNSSFYFGSLENSSVNHQMSSYK